MSDKRCLMVVHAHPDDEVFSTGGILAKYVEAGDRVVVVYSTSGEAGEMYDPDRDLEEATQRLGEIRQEEARKACALLGVTDVVFLGYRDSGMRDTEPNRDPRAFMNASLDEAAGRLLEIMRQTRPQVVVTYNQEGGYGHPDHVMTNRVTTAAFERARPEPWGPQKLYYTAGSREGYRRYIEGIRGAGLEIPWMKDREDEFDFDKYGLLDSEITAHIDISAYISLKKQALAVHRTQIPADFFYLSIPDEVIAQTGSVEYFVRVYPPARPGEHEDDLFAGMERRTEAA